MGSKSIPLAGQPEAWACFTVAANAIQAGGTARDAVAARTGAGVFTITLFNEIGATTTGNNGKVTVDYDSAGQLTCQIAHTSATVKTLTFSQTTTGVATDPTRVSVTVRKLS